MIQGIMELLFDVAYLATALTVGIILVTKGKSKYIKLFGIMAIVLAFGDSFHLVPRVYSLLTDTMANNAAALGFGQMVTSLTMTIFYVILYFIWELRAKPQHCKATRLAIIILAAARLIICLMPQNNWFEASGNQLFGILRNVPFAVMGILIIVLCFKHAKENNDKDYFYMAIAIILSFVFYAPVVLWSSQFPVVGVLMIPKTIAYVWIVFIGFREHKAMQK